MNHKIVINNFTIELEQLPNGKFKKPQFVQKYVGYRYSICSLKQTNETIMIFQKPYKTGSCLHDTLAMENGDKTCTCGALNIDKGRCPTNGETPCGSAKRVFKSNKFTEEKVYGDNTETSPLGRYPAQTFVECICEGKAVGKAVGKASGYDWDEGKQGNVPITKNIKSGIHYRENPVIHTNPQCPCAILDSQNNNVKGGSIKEGIPTGFGVSDICFGDGTTENGWTAYNDKGGCSKILHQCKFEEGEYDLYIYEPKVNKRERDGGLDSLGGKSGGIHNESGRSYKTKCGVCEKEIRTDGRENRCTCKNPIEYYPKIETKNPHPTLKPINLIFHVLSLFKTPNPQRICYPFAGVQSEVIGGYKAGFIDFVGCEISEEYLKIGNARFEYWTKRDVGKKKTNGVVIEKKGSEIEQSSLF